MAQGDVTVNKLDGKVHLIKKAVKQDTKVLTTDPLLLEDEFQSLYFSPQKNTNVIIEPPFNPLQLASLIHRNNILQQCVVAMEVNIDGSGYEFITEDDEKDTVTGDDPNIDGDSTQKDNMGASADAPNDTKTSVLQKGLVRKFAPPNKQDIPDIPDPDAKTAVGVVNKEKEMLEHFFKEPFPGMSFITMRRKIRLDMEATGNGYMEVIRNIAGEVLFLRYLEAVAMRLVKFDSPTDVEVTVIRGGKEVKATMPMRERRFAYKIGANLTYYRDFGSSRQVNKKTGAWIEKGDAQEKDASVLGSEILHFTVMKDFRTHYGLPRWINQLPSVLGSRKSEEFNLEFFDAGGMPPAIIFVQGGALVGGVKEQLQQYLSGKASQKHRAAIVEVMSTSGSLDSAGSVQVKTERFGGSTQDAMFQTYDMNCGEHIRKSFRLPKILVGDTDVMNRATAEASIQAVESQVFQPERFEFDEIINTTIIKALGAKKYVMRSLNMSVADPDLQMKAVQQAAMYLEGEEIVKTANEISGLDMTYSAKAEQANKAAQGGMGAPGGDPNDPNGMGGDPGDAPPGGMQNPPYQPPQNMGTPPSPWDQPNNEGQEPYGEPPYVGQGPNQAWKTEKSEKPVRLTPTAIVKLASDWSIAMGLSSGKLDDKQSVLYQVDSLVDGDRKFFDTIIVQKMFKDADPEAVALIQSCGHDHT